MSASAAGTSVSFKRVRTVNIDARSQDERAYMLEPFPLAAPPVPEESRDQPSLLLAARYRVVGFTGREAELRQLGDWRDDARLGIAVRLVHGSGGEGKTRLASEFATASAQAGWAVAQAARSTYEAEAAALDHSAAAAGQWLLLVDYAERWASTDLLSMIRDPLLRSAARLRVLLLARSAGEWWESLKYELEESDIAAGEMPLAPLADSLDARFTVFNTARDRFAEVLQAPEPRRLSLPAGVFTHDAFAMVLTIHMAALAAVHAGLHGEAAPSDPIAVSEYLLKRERDHWRKLYSNAGLFQTRPEVMARAVYTAILTRQVPYDIALTVLDRAGLAATPETASRILDDHAVCYPPTTGVLEPLYPDRLGEDFLAIQTPGHTMASRPDQWTGSAIAKLLALDAGQPVPDWACQAVTVLVEASRRWRHLAERQLYPLLRQRPWLAVAAGGQVLSALAGVPDIELGVLSAVESQLPAGPRVDLDVGIAAVTDRIAAVRLPRTAGAADRADIYLNLGWRQASAGLFEEAAETCERAVRIYESLGPGERAESGLARALDELGNSLSELGRREPALAATERAVATYRRLVAAGEAAHAAQLAAALTDLGRDLWHLDRRQEALAATSEAVRIYQRLTDQQASAPEAPAATTADCRPRLARSLRNLGAMLTMLGEQAAGLAATQEAVDILLVLAAADPRTHEAQLAMALNNLGVDLAEQGRPEAALDATRQAADIGRRLVQVSPAALQPRLALWLTNLGIRLTELDRLAEARQVMAEVIDTRRRLARASPAVHEAGLAASLENFAVWLVQREMPGDAMGLTEEAVRRWRTLAQAGPEQHDSDLARALLTHAWVRWSADAEVTAALGTSEEAMAIYQKLAAQEPESYADDLSDAASVTASLLTRLGRDAQAAALLETSLQDLPGGPWRDSLDLAPVESVESVIRQAASQPDLADRVREAVAAADVYALGKPAAGMSELLHVMVEADGAEVTLLPVFTNPAALRNALIRHPDWQQLSVRSIHGAALLAGVDAGVTVIINPWSDPEYLLSGRPADAEAVVPAEPLFSLPDVESVIRQAAGQAGGADSVREAVASVDIYALGHPAGDTSVPGHGTESDLLHFGMDAADGSEVTLLPVFTNPEVMRDALLRNPDWQQLSVLSVNGAALLGNIDADVRLVINPWSDLEYQLPTWV